MASSAVSVEWIICDKQIAKDNLVYVMKRWLLQGIEPVSFMLSYIGPCVGHLKTILKYYYMGDMRYVLHKTLLLEDAAGLYGITEISKDSSLMYSIGFRHCFHNCLQLYWSLLLATIIQRSNNTSKDWSITWHAICLCQTVIASAM